MRYIEPFPQRTKTKNVFSDNTTEMKFTKKEKRNFWGVQTGSVFIQEDKSLLLPVVGSLTFELNGFIYLAVD